MEDRAYRFGALSLRTSDGSLLRGDELVPLPPKALQVLLVLVRNHGQVVSHEQLNREVWPDTAVEEGTLKVYISTLRKTLAEAGLNRDVLQTVPRRGYRFVAEINRPMPAPAARPPRLTWKHFGSAAAIACLMIAAGFALSRSTMALSPRVLGVRQLTSEGVVCAACALVADPQRVYFTRSVGNRNEIAWIPVNGGAAETIPVPFPNPTVLDVAPSTGELLVSSFDRAQDRRTFWIVPVSGGEGRRLGFDGFDAAWSRDGNHIAYTNGENEIRFVSRTGTVERGPVTTGGFPCKVRWSPDGSRVTYTVLEQDGKVSLWQAGARAGAPWRAAGQPGHALWGEGVRSGGWSPDGAYFFFYSFSRVSSGEGTTTIWARHEAAGPLTVPPPAPARLHDVPGDTDGALAAGDDGRHVFFTARRRTFEPARYDVRSHELLRLSAPILADRIEASPDGQWLAYVPEDGVGLWRCRPDGSAREQLIGGLAEVFHPRWSPDSRSIAMQVDEAGAPGYVAVVRVDEHRVERLLPAAFRSGGPNWSPDGRRLLVDGCEYNSQSWRCTSRFLIVDLDTKRIDAVPGSDALSAPSWSPDGNYIAAHSADDRELRLFDCARGKWSVVRTQGFFTQGFWSRDSEFLFFQDLNERPAQPILRYSRSRGTVERVTPAPIALPAGVSGFRLSGVSPEGEPRVTLVRENSEIYVVDVVMP